MNTRYARCEHAEKRVGKVASSPERNLNHTYGNARVERCLIRRARRIKKIIKKKERSNEVMSEKSWKAYIRADSLVCLQVRPLPASLVL